MKISFLIRNLLRSLYANKRQSLLTMGSLIIGIVSVLLVLSLGNGVNNSISKQLDDVTGGKNTFTINYVSSGDSGGITNNDAKRIKLLKNISSAELGVNPLLNIVQVSNGIDDKKKSANYDELSEKYSKRDQNVHLYSGESLRKVLSMGKATVAIKNTFAKKLFSSKNILGKTIEISGNNYVISTIYTGAEETPDILMSPKVYKQFKEFSPQYNQVKITYEGNKVEAKKLVISYLSKHGELNYDGTYEVEDVHQVVKQINKTTSLATNLIAGVAGISLVVAGFGVMSATYSSISERTSEIGLRRAFGAKRSQIRNQFMLEGLFMTTISSILSLFLVEGLSVFLGDSMGIRLIITWSNVLVSVVVPAVIGLVFTYFPAVSASNKNVLTLLR